MENQTSERLVGKINYNEKIQFMTLEELESFSHSTTGITLLAFLKP